MNEWIRWMERLCGPAALAVALLAWYGLSAYRRLPAPPTPAAAMGTAVAWHPPAAYPAARWIDALRAPDPEDSGMVEEAAHRYRLAGTFLLESAAGTVRRRAVVAERHAPAQHLLREGDRLEDYQVVLIRRDRMVLRREGREHTLRLDEELPGPMAWRGPPAAMDPEDAGGPAVIAATRFGERLADDRWRMSREELLTYYREVLREPWRIVSLYASMRPDRDEDRQIRGYVLQPAGEHAFFEAVGLEAGDIIRKVNSMPMTRQQRAEYFIAEFIQDRVSTLVFDIERDGDEKKIIYQIQ